MTSAWRCKHSSLEFIEDSDEVLYSILILCCLYCIRSRLFTYDDVVERVAQQLGLEDPSKIRLTPHNCYSQQPKPQPIKYRGVEHLSDMLVHYNQVGTIQSFGISAIERQHFNLCFGICFWQTSDILYYEVLDIPLPELQGLKTLKVAFYHATKDEVSMVP